MPRGVLCYAIEGPLFFGAVESLERALAQTHTDPRCIIIRLGRVPFMDATGLQTLEEVVTKLERRGVQVILTEANERVLTKLTRMNIVSTESNVARSTPRLSMQPFFNALLRAISGRALRARRAVHGDAAAWRGCGRRAGDVVFGNQSVTPAREHDDGGVGGEISF